MTDAFGRNINYLRLSITERCNLACNYCRPDDLIECTDKLSLDDIHKILQVSQQCGIEKIKLTGGEPLVRKDIIQIIAYAKLYFKEVTLTTNGMLLNKYANSLIGIDGINVSIDTFSPQKFKNITGADGLNLVLRGIDNLLDLGLRNIKINMVAIKDFTEHEIEQALNFIKDKPIHLRFIELMPIGLGIGSTPLPIPSIQDLITNLYGDLTPDNKCYGNGPAKYYSLQGFVGKVGFISAISHNFCHECNRIRITSDGYLKFCLHHNTGINLYDLLGYPVDKITKIIKDEIHNKPNQHDFINQTKDSIDIKNMYTIGG